MHLQQREWIHTKSISHGPCEGWWGIPAYNRVLVSAYWNIHAQCIECVSLLDGTRWTLVFLLPLLYSSSVVPKCHYCLGSAWGACLESGAPPQRFCFQVSAVRLGSPDCWQASRASEAALNDFEPIWFGQQVRLQSRHTYFSTSNFSCAYFIYFLSAKDLFEYRYFQQLNKNWWSIYLLTLTFWLTLFFFNKVVKQLCGSPSLHHNHTCSFNSYLLIIFYVPGTVLRTRDQAENKKDKTSAGTF